MAATQQKKRAVAGPRMIRVRCLAEDATWQGTTPKELEMGPRRLKQDEIFYCPEHMISELWMQPLEDYDPSLREAAKAQAALKTSNDVIRINRRSLQNSDAEDLGSGGVNGNANEPPLPMPGKRIRTIPVADEAVSEELTQ